MANPKKYSDNRKAGHDWEREGRKRFDAIMPGVQTSRYANRYLDDMGIDLAFTEPFAPQYKVISGRHMKLLELLKDIPLPNGYEIPTLHVKFREKKGSKFLNVGEVTVLHDKDFFKLLKANEYYHR